MQAQKPRKTLADFLAVAVSPALIMLLVGSLSFFLTEVFYRGDRIAGVRWVLFWFVIAIVLVSRIGIEQSAGHAMIYGLGLAAATWLYLLRTQPAFLLGAALLAIVWWCAHKLTWDCTLIDDDEDASGQGVLQDAWPKTLKSGRKDSLPPNKNQKASPGKRGSQTKRRPKAPHRPGRWVVYFSIAALPLFGIGQVLLPTGGTGPRRMGFAFLLVYLGAALGLLLTTSFLGLRRYLRQRFLRMPANIAFGWIRFGAGVALAVLALALLLPRPGADYTWKTLGYKIDYQLRRASEYASRANSHGEGQGRAGNETGPTGSEGGSQATPAAQRQAQARQPGQPGRNQPLAKPVSSPPSANGTTGLHRLLRALLICAGAALFAWWLVRNWSLVWMVARSFLVAILQVFRNIFAFGLSFKPGKQAAATPAAAKAHPFAAYANPFITGKDRVWPPEQLILYTYDALRAWAREGGVEPQPQQTPREFCQSLHESLPEAAPELNVLSTCYANAVYGTKLPDAFEPAPFRQLWRCLTESLPH